MNKSVRILVVIILFVIIFPFSFFAQNSIDINLFTSKALTFKARRAPVSYFNVFRNKGLAINYDLVNLYKKSFYKIKAGVGSETFLFNEMFWEQIFAIYLKFSLNVNHYSRLSFLLKNDFIFFEDAIIGVELESKGGIFSTYKEKRFLNFAFNFTYKYLTGSERIPYVSLTLNLPSYYYGYAKEYNYHYFRSLYWGEKSYSLLWNFYVGVGITYCINKNKCNYEKDIDN